jgi:hypothetical protein
MPSGGIHKNMQQNAKTLNYPIKSKVDGGDEGIRTLETVSRLLP